MSEHYMFGSGTTSYFTLQSLFTRKGGYQQIKSSKKLNQKEAVQILNLFTPQGASPKISLRIGPWNDMLGVGYYYMNSEDTAMISTLLFENIPFENRVRLPMDRDAIELIAGGTYEQIFGVDYIESLDLASIFGIQQTSMILYSILGGDNMIVIHPDHEKRVSFVKSILEIMPSHFLRYNRITTGCTELDGNENIIGVEILPKKYRSHKKLYMALDTVFVDLVDEKVVGEGLKSNSFTTELSQVYSQDRDQSRLQLHDFFQSIMEKKFDGYDDYGENGRQLITRIRQKMGLEQPEDGNWIMSF